MTIPEITKRYLEGKTNTEFATELGIQVSDASVSYWKNGDRKPSFETLKNIRKSETSSEAAKAWASECLEAGYGVRTGLSEPTFDLEIERRR